MTPLSWTPEIAGEDIIFHGLVTWFGGPNDPGDDGSTASGMGNHKLGVIGCALPQAVNFNGTKVDSCAQSPLPTIPWGWPVEFSTDAAHTAIAGIIDEGPADDTGHCADLAPAVFLQLHDTLSDGVIVCQVRVIGGAVLWPKK